VGVCGGARPGGPADAVSDICTICQFS